jgi:hypothetical protein|tara:strand:+ start:111 stop:500 length:390 start_codon:yes stop_codon:yes gene_type:complete
MQEHVIAYTLVDISETSALQMQNFNALVQAIQLRANIDNVDEGIMGNQDLTQYKFGSDFGGEHNVWVLSFTTEQQKLFDNITGEFGGLKEDVHNVPVITGLYESVNVAPAVFDTLNPKTKNIYFMKQTF